MDIAKIHKYLSYEPHYNEDPTDVLESLLTRLSYLQETEKEELRHAYRFAHHHHKDMKRLSWEPYIIHPLRVFEFLIDIQPDISSMKATFLHDLLEDTAVTLSEIEAEFGPDVAMLCEGLVKVWKVRYRGEDRQLETLKKTFLAMWKDLRVIFIKLADRLHNIQTLEYHPTHEKKVRIAQETIKIFVPIASRLWLYVYQNYLENWAFKILYPQEYKKISDYLSKAYSAADELREKGREMLKTMCIEEGIDIVEVKWRLKSPYRIRKKMKKYETNDVNKVMDVLAFRVITKNVTDCYATLGVVHKHFTPIFTKMKDYIAISKPNGYKSLHTTVLGMFDFPVEIQVRTEEMDRIAEYGVAAHFAYKEHEWSVEISDKQSAWIKQIQDIVQRYQSSTDKEDFKSELDIEILQKTIYVYTPQGDIIELPPDSTVLDFAFRVHTEVGLKFKNGFVNGRIVPIDYKLKTWDIISIESFKNKYTVSKWWIEFLHTPSAKSKLNRYIRKLEKDSIIKEVTDQLNEKLAMYGLPLIGAKEDLISKRYKWNEFELLVYKIYDKQTTVMKVLQENYTAVALEHTQAIKAVEKKKEAQTAAQVAIALHEATAEVIIDGDKVLGYEYCQMCLPQPPQKIIAKSDRHGIKVHTLNCPALQTISYNKFLEAHRKHTDPTEYMLRLVLQTKNAPGIMYQIFKIFDFLVVNIHDLRIHHLQEYTEITVDLDIKNPYKMYYILEELKNKKDLLKVIGREIL